MIFHLSKKVLSRAIKTEANSKPIDSLIDGRVRASDVRKNVEVTMKMTQSAITSTTKLISDHGTCKRACLFFGK